MVYVCRIKKIDYIEMGIVISCRWIITLRPPSPLLSLPLELR